MQFDENVFSSYNVSRNTQAMSKPSFQKVWRLIVSRDLTNLWHTRRTKTKITKNIDVYIVYLFGFFSKKGSGPKYFGYNTVLLYFSFSGVPLQGNSKQPYMRLPFVASHTKNVAEVKQSDPRFRLYVCIYVYECMFFRPQLIFWVPKVTLTSIFCMNDYIRYH